MAIDPFTGMPVVNPLRDSTVSGQLAKSNERADKKAAERARSEKRPPYHTGGPLQRFPRKPSHERKEK